MTNEELVVSTDVYPNSSVDCVLLFSENSPRQEATEKYTIHAIIRMRGYRNLTLDEKLITYQGKLVATIDKMREDQHAPLFGFLNFDEAQQIFCGTLENGVSRALRSTRRDNLQIVDIYFKDGEITVVPQQKDTPQLDG